MKRILISVCLAVSTLSIMAQNTYIRVWKNGAVSYQNNIDYVDSINFVRQDEAEIPLPQLEAIDMGLPSGTKWANMNVGALSPEDHGYYFQWGCTSIIPSPNWLIYCHGQEDSLTKYCTDSVYGDIDGLIYLESGDDPATALLGSEWRSPTWEEVLELFRYCSSSYQMQGGEIQGYKITSKGASIYLPNNGYIGLDGTLIERNRSVMLWTSSLNETNNNSARALILQKERSDLGDMILPRAYACGIRPVYNEKRRAYINPDSLVIEVGDTCHLTVNLYPKNLIYHNEDFVWESSDTTVATVSPEGIVTTHGKGEATITAQYDTLCAYCHVRVRRWIEELSFTGAYFGAIGNYDFDVYDTIRTSYGVYRAKLVPVYVVLCTSGLYFQYHGELTGVKDGGLVEFIAPMYYDPYGGYFIEGEWNVFDMDTVLARTIPTGKANANFIPNMKGYLANLLIGDTASARSYLTAADSLGCEGAVMRRYTYHTMQEGYESDGYYVSEMPLLFFTEGSIDVTWVYSMPSIFMNGIASHHLVAKPLLEQRVDAENYYHYGCNWHYDTTTGIYSWNDEQVHWGEPYTYDYNTSTAAPSRTRGEYTEIHNVGDVNTTRMIIETLRRIPTDNKAAQE